ncbi:hypothetical protein PBRA_008473 [Plasmodiophora brassicae]|uniref:Uncharacterized protein n=1 Tax=Plasmodiophora brassicae TaxID=37360 RepID=A0A0G4J1L2_PLABS|nr:hypothetical protein PBRA_008473 [Plasmodiophora brassicae]
MASLCRAQDGCRGGQNRQRPRGSRCRPIRVMPGRLLMVGGELVETHPLVAHQSLIIFYDKDMDNDKAWDLLRVSKRKVVPGPIVLGGTGSCSAGRSAPFLVRHWSFAEAHYRQPWYKRSQAARLDGTTVNIIYRHAESPRSCLAMDDAGSRHVSSCAGKRPIGKRDRTRRLTSIVKAHEALWYRATIRTHTR